MRYEAGLPNERLIMKNKELMLVLLFLIPGALMAQQPAASQDPQASVTSLTSKDLREFPGKEVLMITVEYPPGGVDPIHRHNAHAFVYVLEAR
jgi:quercetin dioxygenase-like cupin family protein